MDSLPIQRRRIGWNSSKSPLHTGALVPRQQWPDGMRTQNHVSRVSPHSVPMGNLPAMARLMAARLSGVAGTRENCTSTVSCWFPSSTQSIYQHFDQGPVFHAEARTTENAHDMKSVSQSDVEDLVEPRFADELFSTNFNAATAYHQFPDVAASIIKRHKGTRTLREETSTGAHCWFVPESHGCKS